MLAGNLYFAQLILIYHAIKQLNKMIPHHTVIEGLIRSNTSFAILGPPSSGKTTFIESLLIKTNAKYIKINCALFERKSAFLKLITMEIKDFLGIQPEQKVPQCNADIWLKQMKQYQYISTYRKKLDGLYFFFDNIEQLILDEKFLNSFYLSCRSNFSFKIDFIFCGTCLSKKIYEYEEPFRDIKKFTYPKPQDSVFRQKIEKTITDVIEKSELKSNNTQKDLTYIISQLTSKVVAAYIDIQRNLDNIERYTRILTEHLVPLITHQDKNEAKKLYNNMDAKMQLNRQLRELLNNDERTDYAFMKKLQGNENDGSWRKTPFYCNLFITALHIADVNHENTDPKLFKDSKGNNQRRVRQGQFKRNISSTLPRHNLQRIIALSQVLESQSDWKQKSKLKQAGEFHHNLDYYACFQYLNDKRSILFVGRSSTWGFGKIQGKTNEQDVKNFMTGVGLNPQQFICY